MRWSGPWELAGGAPQARGEILRLRRAATASRGPLNADVRHHMSATTVVILLLGIVAIGLLALPRTARAQESPDAQVIAQLRKAGSNLSKPHEVEFFLYVPTPDAADRLASKLHALHFGAKVDEAAQGPGWLVLATKSMIPTESALVAIRTQFTALAAAENGEYDGWGTPIVE